MRILLFVFVCFLLALPGQVFSQCFTTVDVGPDLTICEPGGQVQLQAVINGPSDFYEWTPPDGLSNPSSLSPSASVFSTISYVFSSYWLSANNLVVNGDFEAGNQGFTSDYVHNPTNLVPEGTYAIIQSPSLVSSNFPPCDDHTFMDGTGLLMAVNGGSNPGDNVWCQTVPVTPETYYNFSAWAMTIIPFNPAQLQFSVNGEYLGNIFNVPNTPCQWTNFNEEWYSGSNTSATLCIVSQTTGFFGNDFALDDIAFFEYCKASDTVTIEVQPNSIVDVQEFLCVGECYTIGNQSFCTTGFYSQTIPSANGCDSTVNLDLTVLNPVAVIQDADPLSCYNNFMTTLDASFSSSTPFSSYFWTGPNGFTSTQQNPIVTEPGTYSLTVTESGGGVSCSATADVTVDYFGDFPVAITGPAPSLTCANPSGVLDGSNSSFGNEITYNWSGPGGFSADTVVTSVSQAGVYTLTVTNTQSGCTATDVVLVEADLDTPLVTASSDTITCAQPEAVLSAVTDSLATGFLWSGPQGFSDTILITQTAVPGEYILEVLGANGCPGADTILVAVDSTLPNFSLTGGLLSCLGQSDTITFESESDVDNFWWSGPDGFSSADSMPEVTVPGWYLATVTGQNGCVLMDSVEVVADTVGPDLMAQGSVIDCQSGSVSVSASSPDSVVSWEWSGPGGFAGSGQAVQVSQSGIYTVIATSPNGCTTAAQATVTPGGDLPDLEATGGLLTCVDSVVTLSAQSQAGVSVFWSGPGGFSSPLWDVEVTVPGSYTAVVTGANDCQIDVTVEVGIDTISPQFQLPGGMLNCVQSTVVLAPALSTDSVFFFWSNSVGFISADSLIEVDIPGDYTLIVTAQNGCTDSQTVTVSQDTAQPTALLTAGVLTCDVEQLSVTADISASQPTFMWNGPDGFTSADQNPVVSLSGLYTLDILDSLNGCESTFSIEVLADTLPPVIAAFGDTLTCTAPVGLVQSTVIPDPAVWSWSGPDGFMASGSAASVDEAGEYMVLAIGENGCADSLSVTVSIDTIAPDLDVSGPAASCAVPNPVWQAISIQSETYEWGGAGGFTAVGASTPLPAPGVYKLSGTAANGCLTELTFEVPADTTAPVVSAQGGEISCDAGVLTLTGTTDSVQSPILWSGPGGFFSSALSPEVSLPGIYELTVTAANGCQGSDTALVMADEDIPDLTLSGDTITCLEPVAQLIGGSATAGVTFAWDGPNGFQSSESEPDATIPGPYTLTVTAPNGCSATAQTTVAIDTTSPVITTLGLVLTCFEPEQPLPATLIEPADATLGWSGPDGFVSDQLQPVVTSGGAYVLTATAGNGCSSTALADVGVDTVSPGVVLSTTGILTCAEPVQNVIAADPGVGMLFVEWLDQGGVLVSNELSFEANVGGTYLCRMTNMENGCASEASIELVEDFTPATAVITAENGGVLTCDFPSIVLSGVQSTPVGALGYLWQSPSGLPAGSQSEVVVSEGGVYQLIVEHLSSGCRDTAVTQVSVDQEIPVVTVAPPGILTCAQTELRLDAAGSSAGVEFVYAWTAQPGLILEGATGAEPLIGQAGTYQLRITDSSNGCADSVSVTVTADTVPPVAAATALDELNCVTNAVTLTSAGSSTGSDISLLWTTLSGGILSGDPSSEEVEALSAGLYLLQVERTSNGCTASDTVVVTENTAVPSSIATDVEPPYCPGGRGRLTITSVLGGTPPYLYSLNGQAFSPQVAYDNLAPGMYTVVVQDVIGCEDSVTVTIDEPAGPQVFLPDAINMRFSETRQLLPDLNFPESLIDSLIWSPEDFLSCTDCLRPFVALPRHTITYRLTIVTTEGCSADAEILVRVNRLRSVYVPNAFSPGNQDGFNDELTVYGPVDEVRRINRFAIFDRWGEQVFEARDFAPNDPTAGWNGQHRGQMMEPGVFVYLAEVEFVDGEVVLYEGDVVLVR